MNLLKYLSALVILSLSLNSCDVIDDPIKDGVTPVLPDTNDVQRVVLLEEFTGVRCNNCPDAAKEAKRLRGIYGDQIVLVGIHATSLAEPDAKHPVDFTTPEGDNLASFFNLPGVPIGFMDRRGYTGSGGILKPYNVWANEVQQALDEPVVANLAVSEESDNGNILKVSVDLTPLADFTTRDIWMNVILLEDSIVAPQTLPDKSVQDDYVHNHVYRTSFNGAYGEPLNSSNWQQGTTVNKTFSVNFSSEWIKDNSEVVAYIYDHDNYQVLQAAHIKL